MAVDGVRDPLMYLLPLRLLVHKSRQLDRSAKLKVERHQKEGLRERRPRRLVCTNSYLTQFITIMCHLGEGEGSQVLFYFGCYFAVLS